MLVSPMGPVEFRCKTWRCVARARAAENLVYVVVTQNLFTPAARGRSCIAGPEEMLVAQFETVCAPASSLTV